MSADGEVGIKHLNPPNVGDCDQWTIPKRSNDRCDDSLINKMIHFKNLKMNGVHFNDKLQTSKQFMNPHIGKKLIDWVDVHEHSSNIPEPLPYDGYEKKYCSASAISQKQQIRAERKSNSYKDGSSKRSHILFTPSTNKKNKSNK